MKANEAPKKIYLQVCGDCQDNECDNCKFEDLEDNVTWCKDKIFEKDIEYIRKDAFIKKSCDWLKENGGCYWMDDYDLPTDELVEDFRKYMEE